jgi:predicted transcriptional regulator
MEMYLEPSAIRDVAERMEISYGTAYALIKEAGGQKVFRPRGTRAARKDRTIET